MLLSSAFHIVSASGNTIDLKYCPEDEFKKLFANKVLDFRDFSLILSLECSNFFRVMNNLSADVFGVNKASR